MRCLSMVQSHAVACTSVPSGRDHQSSGHANEGGAHGYESELHRVGTFTKPAVATAVEFACSWSPRLAKV